MKKFLTYLFMFILCGYVYPLPGIYPSHASSLSVITVDGDVIMGNTLPREGVICEVATVHGSPREDSQVIGLLSTGTTVRIREQSHGSDRSWVMIKPANWIRLDSLCK